MKNKLIKKMNCTNDEFEVYYYGFLVILCNVMSLVMVVGLGMMTNQFIHALLFLIFYLPIRVCVGGFHFRKVYLCIPLFLLFSWLSLQGIEKCHVSVIFSILINIPFLLIEPISFDNNLNTYMNQKRNRKRIQVIVMISCFIAITIHQQLIYNALFICGFGNFILYIVGYLTIHCQKRYLL